MTLDTALVGLAATLLGTLVVTTWRSASLATRLLAAVQNGEKRDAELTEKVKALDGLPALTQRVGQLEELAKQVPKTIERVAVLEAARHFSKEMHAVTREFVRHQSRPDADEE